MVEYGEDYNLFGDEGDYDSSGYEGGYEGDFDPYELETPYGVGGGFGGYAYSPPGVQAPVNQYNYEPSAGGYLVYDPDEVAPIDQPQFNYGMDVPPTREDQTSALQNYLNQFVGWTGPTGRAGTGMGETTDTGREGAVGEGLQMGQRPLEPPVSTTRRTGTQRGDPLQNYRRAESDLANARARGAPPETLAELEALADEQWGIVVDAIGAQNKEAARLAEQKRQDELQKQRQDRADALYRAAQASAKGQPTPAQAAAAQSMAALTAQQAQTPTAQEAADQRRYDEDRKLREREMETEAKSRRESEQFALAIMLLENSSGPNGPANRAMGLQILASLGVTVTSPVTGPATPPNVINPAIWDAMSPMSQQLILDAWVANGGTVEDFLFAIDQQRPKGTATQTQRRFAAPVGA